VRARGIDGFPINLSKRSVLSESLDEVRIRDIRTAERHQICQPLGDKAIAAITVHLHVRDQSASVERTEMPEHAIVGQFLKWRTGEVGSIPHEQ
jgi:hypothetical protein